MGPSVPGGPFHFFKVFSVCVCMCVYMYTGQNNGSNAKENSNAYNHAAYCGVRM